MSNAITKRDLLVGAVLLPLGFLVSTYSRGDKAFLAVLAAVMFYVLLTWMPEYPAYRGRPRFWAALAVLAAAHAVALYVAPLPGRIAGPGILLAPFGFADVCLMYLAIRWVMRGRPRPTPAGDLGERRPAPRTAARRG